MKSFITQQLPESSKYFQILNLHHDGELVIPGDPLEGRIVQPSSSSYERRQATTDFYTANGTNENPSIQSSKQELQQEPIIQYVAGAGTYIRYNKLFASIVGKVQITTSTISIPNSTSDKKSIISISGQHQTEQTVQVITTSVIPQNGRYRGIEQVIHKGQIVLGRISNIVQQQQQGQQHQVHVDIVANQYGLLDIMTYGIIRSDDITKIKSATTISSTGASSLTQYFRIGDYIVAKVVLLGDDNTISTGGSRYYLTTAESSLGVIYATCSSSDHKHNDSITNNISVMIPISHDAMECPVCGIIEARKCARPPL